MSTSEALKGGMKIDRAVVCHGRGGKGKPRTSGRWTVSSLWSGLPTLMSPLLVGVM